MADRDSDQATPDNVDPDNVVLDLEHETDPRALEILRYRARNEPLKGRDRDYLRRLYGLRRNPESYKATESAARLRRKQVKQASGGNTGKFLFYIIYYQYYIPSVQCR